MPENACRQAVWTEESSIMSYERFPDPRRSGSAHLSVMCSRFQFRCGVCAVNIESTRSHGLLPVRACTSAKACDIVASECRAYTARKSTELVDWKRKPE